MLDTVLRKRIAKMISESLNCSLSEANDSLDQHLAEVIARGVVSLVHESRSRELCRAKYPLQHPALGIPHKRSQKHTCGKDGDPGAVAPLSGICDACLQDAKNASRIQKGVIQKTLCVCGHKFEMHVFGRCQLDPCPCDEFVPA